MKHWVKAMRLRTLPLAFASISMGGILAAINGLFDFTIYGFCLLTTFFLQILSNLANDYGDSISGVDGSHREGPSRTIQDGLITRASMKKAMLIFTALSLLFGLSLLYISGVDFKVFLFFIILGLAAIIAAVLYTNGKLPYGYIGLGDLSVFLFFGLLGVLGTLYLQTKSLNLIETLPAVSVGLFSVAVLNVNNIRDIKSDEASGKKSIPVMLGRKNAVYYHWVILLLGILASILYSIIRFTSPFQFIYLVVIPLLFINAKAVKNITEAKKLDKYLKQMAMSTLMFVLLFGISNLI